VERSRRDERVQGHAAAGDLDNSGQGFGARGVLGCASPCRMFVERCSAASGALVALGRRGSSKEPVRRALSIRERVSCRHRHRARLDRILRAACATVTRGRLPRSGQPRCPDAT
jgi:hypothetical protein